MNKLRQKLDKKFPHGWNKVWQSLGYESSYSVTSHTNEDIEKATFSKMKPEEIKAWGILLEVSHSELIFDYGCGLERLTAQEINQLIKHEGYKVDRVAHAA